MNPSFRVFSTSDALLEPITIVQQLSALGVRARGKFREGFDWFEAELILDDVRSLLLERYLEDEIGSALESWVAWLEEAEDLRYHRWLKDHVVQTRQLFTSHQPPGKPGESEMSPLVAEVCAGLCRFLARETRGVYQVDGQGFFDADGMLLVEEEGEPPEDDAEARA